MENKIILVDIDDNEIGEVTKQEAHCYGKLHRAFSIFIINGDKMLIQRRNVNKYHSGGLWANACCSHPRYGEKLEYSIHRRLLEEVGIDCELREMFHFVYKTDYKEDLHEYEYDHVFLGEYSGECSINSEEIDEIKWVNIEDLKKDLVNNPENYASWFIIAAPRLMEELNIMK